MNLTIVEALQRGILLQNQKRHLEAKDIYERVLVVSPRHPDALHLLGLVWSALGDHRKGAEYIRKAIDEMPSNATYLGNLGVVLKFGGDIFEAIAAYEKAIALEPRNATHYFHLGKSYKAIDRLEDAERAFRKAIEVDPKSESPWLSLIRTISDKQGAATAVPVAESAIILLPKSAELRLSHASLLRRSGDYEGAMDAYRDLLKVHPEHVEAMCKLASLAFSHHHFDMGRPFFELAQQLAPESHHLISTSALLQNTNGNSTEAIRLYQQAITIDDQIASYHANLGTALRKQGRFDEALKSIRTARNLDIAACDLDVVEGGVLLGIGEHEQAIHCLERAIADRQGYREAHHALLMALQYRPGVTSEALYQEHQRWGNTFCQNASAPMNLTWDRRRPLRLGFVSADLGQHPVGYFAARFFESLDPSRFEVIVYSDRLASDPLSEKISKTVKHWKRTEQWSDERLLEDIRQDGIDVLFDLAGHTAQNRLMVFAKRAAPIQISWAGYVGTTGVPAMDYVIADPQQITESMEAFYSESVLRMPFGYITYLAPDGAPNVNDLPLSKRGYVTFGALCNPSKVNEEVLLLWREILYRIPNSRMVLSYTGWLDGSNRERVRRCWNDQLFERVDFRAANGVINAMQVYHDIDIALDTFPYSGGLTTIEAMYMGVPTITLPGDTFAGRHSLSHLMNVGLKEMVANSEKEYVDKAVELANDVKRLQSIRSELRQRVLESPLCNGPQFARAFEALMHQVAENLD